MKKDTLFRFSMNEFLPKVKELIPDCCIAIDLIVGFPGETDSDFEIIINIVKSPVFVLSYSHCSERINHAILPFLILFPILKEQKGASKCLPFLKEENSILFGK